VTPGCISRTVDSAKDLNPLSVSALRNIGLRIYGSGRPGSCTPACTCPLGLPLRPGSSGTSR
jgi:hypothetical protein